MRIFVLGGVSVDTVVHVQKLPTSGSETLFAKSNTKTIGSTGSGKALTLHQLGADVVLHGLIGDDEEGKLVRSFFETQHCPAIWDMDPLGTPTHLNLMDDVGGRISIFTNSGTFEPKLDEIRIEEEIRKADIVVLNIINYTRRFIPLLLELKKEVWVDLHDYDGVNPYHLDYVKIADALFLSKDHFQEDLLRTLLQYKAKFVVMTDGANGSVYLNQNNLKIKQAAIQANLVDANGAGDAFFSAYLYAYMHRSDVQSCLRFASLCAAKTVESELIYCPKLTHTTFESFRKESK